MDKSIIGYKLKYSEHKKVVVAALRLSSVFEPNIIIAGMIGYYLPKIKELGIIDWFEPVYEIIKEEPMCAEKTIKLSLEQAKKMYGKNPEMDELLLANFSKEELTKKDLPKRWEELDYFPGNYISSQAEIKKSLSGPHKNTFATEKQAKSALAMAQLSQLMAVYNEGWEADWSYRNNRSNWTIIRHGDELKWQNVGQTYSFFAFKSLKLCELFLKNFESLIKEYFMID